MVSVEYLKTTARLKESVLGCESERLSLEQKLKAIKNSPAAGEAGALSSYYRDLCRRETSMQRRAQALLEELDRSEASLRGLARRAEQLRARRDQILGERGPQWRDHVIDFLRRQTSEPAAAAAGDDDRQHSAGAAGAGAASSRRSPAATLMESGGVGAGGSTSGEVPPLQLSQLSRSSGGGTAGGGGGGTGWNTSGALLGMTESSIESTGLSRAAGPQTTLQQPQAASTRPPPPPPPEPRHRVSAIDEVAATAAATTTDEFSRRSLDTTGSIGDSGTSQQQRPVSDLTLSGLAKLLDFVDSEMARAQPRILAAFYASSPPSDALRSELCRAANGPAAGFPSHLSAVSATCVVLEELELVVATRLPGGCVFPGGMVSGLAAVRDPAQLERQVDMNLGDEARSLWRRLLAHMRRLMRRTRRPSLEVARLFCPALLHHSASDSLGDQLALVAARILDLPEQQKQQQYDGDDDDEDEDSVTIASDKMPPRRQQPPPPPQPQRPVAESMLATAGSFVDEESEAESDEAAAAAKAPAAPAASNVGGVGGGGLNVTVNPDLRASESDAHIKAYAAALQDDSADESSITELTQQSGTNRSGFFSHNSPQRNLKDSNAYQKMLYGALGASANLGKSTEATATSSASASAKDSKGGGGESAKLGQSSPGDKLPWKSTQELVKDDHDLESDIDSELENSFRLRLSGGGTFKGQLAAGASKAAARPPPTHAENEDEDFGGFYD